MKRKSKLLYNQFWCHVKILYSKMLSLWVSQLEDIKCSRYHFTWFSHFFFHCQGTADNKCWLKYTANFDSGLIPFILTCVYTFLTMLIFMPICPFLGQKNPLEEEMAVHTSILAWRAPWVEEPGRLQSLGSQRVGQDCVLNISTCVVIDYVFLSRLKKIILQRKTNLK